MIERDIDIRVFRRYPFDAAFELLINGRSYRAKTTDYSLNSLGIIVEAVGILNAGDRVVLNVEALNIHQEGEVIWAKSQADTIRAGIVKKGMLTGNFGLYRLSDLLIGFQRTLINGVLNIHFGTVSKKIYIKNGNIVYAESNQDEDRLGDVLLREGRISPEQYTRTAKRKESSHERYVSILVSSGFLRPSELLGAAALQAVRIVESLFTLPDAEFEFLEAGFSVQPPVTLELAVAELIYREVKKGADTELLKKYLPDSIVDFSSTPLNLFQNIHLDAADRAILSHVDGRTTIRDIIRAYSLSMEETLRCFYALLEARILETRDSGKPLSEVSDHLVSSGEEELYCEIIDKIDGMYLKSSRIDYYGLLEVSHEASPEEIRKAYFSAAKAFHPDMHIGLPYDIKEKLVNIFSCINNAYMTLKDYEKRMAYDLSQGKTPTGIPGTPAAPEDSAADAVLPSGRSGQEGVAHTDFAVNAGIARSKYEEGKAQFRKKKFDEAVHLFASAIYFDSSRPEYHFHYGWGLENLGKLKEALQSLTHAFEMVPNSPDILAEIGHVYLKIGCPLRARGNFTRALAIASSHPRAQEGVALLEEESSKEKK
ncbi:MAG: hypothetical protein C0402_08015 [Thermodesulfovibrio sp.]|nr:hypothetical protein [Thermodesulfovibrio sp.]